MSIKLKRVFVFIYTFLHNICSCPEKNVLLERQVISECLNTLHKFKHTKGSFEAAFSCLSKLRVLDISDSHVDCTRALEVLPSMPWVAQLEVLGLAGTNVQGMEIYAYLVGIHMLSKKMRIFKTRQLDHIFYIP